MKKTVLIISFICMACFSYAQQYTINANLTGFNNGTRFYLKDIDVDSDIDSTIIQDGKFTLKGKLPNNPQVVWLYARVEKKFYYTVLLLNNEAVNVKGDSKDFPFDVVVTGSKLQEDRTKLNNLTRAGYKRRNKLVEEYLALKGDSAEIKSKEIWKTIRKIDSTDNANRIAYVKQNLNSYTALNELFYLKKTFPKDTLQKMYNSLLPEFKQSRFGQRIATFLKVGNILKKGDISADFTAVDRNGKTHRLSDNKGKYILLDFSTTYCGPCIESIADLRSLSKKYDGQMEIISFSGDGGKATWLKGIDRDKPTWKSLWDGKGNYGETILKYGVTGYPTFVLIDPEGKIVEKWSGYGKNDDGKGSLETEVDKLLAKQ